MGARYGATTNATNTVSAVAPMFNLVGSASKRVRLYEIVSGSDATPADNAAKFQLQRSTARGTQSTTVTPLALDPADGAYLGTGLDTSWSVNPTLTASSFPQQFPQNQRATFRWVAYPQGEIVIPATAANGLALMSAVASATANYAFSIAFEE